MKRRVKIPLLLALKYSGILALSRWMTRKQLRILCYHGISVGDQHVFNPLLFMRAETFDRRLNSLLAQGWRVIALDSAVEALRAGTIPEKTAVITIDDGWASTLTQAAPILRRHQARATLYVTSYYVEHRCEVFNVALRYVVWKSPLAMVRLETGVPALDREYRIKPDGSQAVSDWIENSRNLDAERRQEVLMSIVRSLGLVPEEVFRDDSFKLISPEQVRELTLEGVDIQLHTHRHRLPNESLEALKEELRDNRTRLEAWTGKSCNHFCYPDGMYTAQQADWLRLAGVWSATTCDEGHNPKGVHLQKLRRILDRETLTDLEFEAALSGFYELVRWRGTRTAPCE
jgi:peptidoglycan/xylan/chitin deacetylase (PgdA/CDA1 family)